MSEDLEDRQDDDSLETTFSNAEIEDESLSAGAVDDWGGGELEAAYLKALSALEASDLEMPSPPVETPGQRYERVEEARPPSNSSQSGMELDEQDLIPEPLAGIVLESTVLESTVLEASKTDPNPPSPAIKVKKATSVAEIPPTPRQIIEACLFVGGMALTSKRLSGVLRGTFEADFVEREIDTLNRLYAAENRPYEIRMGEGGFRMALREEFERIRNKVYGLGPKEVRLSQEALEVLAVVAYHQPIKQSKVEELGKPGCGPVLRQLVRRELIAVERDPAHPRDVNYKTTPRFLSLFDIRSLDELPRHEQVAYK
jgi:segregation and condensation protein B